MFTTNNTMPTTYNLRQVAEFLSINGVGRNTLMKILRKANVLDYNGFPYDKYVEAGYFSFRTRFVNRNHIYNAATVLGKKGLNFISETVNEYLNQEKKYE